MSSISLLGSPTRIEAPFISIEIGGHVFGVKQVSKVEVKDGDNTYIADKIIYPNYVDSLTIEKINGQVNQYTLTLTYVIRPQDDPNFFEKIFSSVNNTRKIKFTYGDASMPNFIYKNEEAIITNIGKSFNFKGASITYTVSAVSSAKLAYSGSFTFPAYVEKPSTIIETILSNKEYGLQELFYGMTDMASVKFLGLIPGDDQIVHIKPKENISVFEYVKYLVSCMIPQGINTNKNDLQTYYALTVHDELIGETTQDEKVEILGGPYFQISSVTKNIEHSDAYEVDIGYPSNNIVLGFNVQNNENYSIYYNWQSELTDEEYVLRINDDGEWEKEYAPRLGSKNDEHIANPEDKVWWGKVTQYPVSATLSLKGLIRPAILMQYVKINILFFGKKYIDSGTYIITKQTDTINKSGYRTDLQITRVVGEDESEYDY